MNCMLKILRRIGNFLLDIIQTVVVALSLFVIVYLFFFQPHQVKGSSMMPNFVNAEYLLTDKISYRFDEPARGDVVVFKAPKNEEYEYIKRIIGLPNESIKVENGSVFINDEKLEENYLSEDLRTNSGSFLKEGQRFLIPEDYYIVMGDNRNHSSDSREWGPVPKENIVGKTWLRYWPLPSGSIGKNAAGTCEWPKTYTIPSTS